MSDRDAAPSLLGTHESSDVIMIKQEDFDTNDDNNNKPSPIKSSVYDQDTDDEEAASCKLKHSSSSTKHPSPIASSSTVKVKHEENVYDQDTDDEEGSVDTSEAKPPNISTTQHPNTNEQISPFDLVSDEILFHIFQYVTPAESARFGLTDKKWVEKILLLHDNHQYYGYEDVYDILPMRLWKLHAINRWGSVLHPDPPRIDLEVDLIEFRSTWYKYYRHRCSTSNHIIPKQTSHLNLIQETYAHDPYQLLTACILSSRTSGGDTIRNIVRDFITEYPTPTLVINGDITSMAKLLHPLGLNRERTMKRFAMGYMQPWDSVADLHGCGAFAASSFAVFCHGDYISVLKDRKADKNVKAYAAYLKRVCEGIKTANVGGKEDSNNNGSNLQMKKKGRKRTSPKDRAQPIRRMTRSRR